MAGKTKRTKIHKILYINILLLSIPLLTLRASPTVTPNKMMLLTGNLDSLARSYTKKGFTILNGLRDPGNIFTDSIWIENGSLLVFASPSPTRDNWQTTAIKTYRNHVAGLEFLCDNTDSLYRALQSQQIPCVILSRANDSISKITSFAIDSCRPLDIVIRQGTLQKRRDSSAIHRNNVYRIDWLLLSAGSRMQEIMQTFFKTTTETFHQGCCDFWRLGPSDNFTFVRFEALPAKTATDPYWLSIEADNFYFAY